MNAHRNEMTIDQLAAHVGMTVRNVRAYASRGLIAPPRLVGRTGYYGEEHAARLELVRSLIDRGYTLNAVEKAFQEGSGVIPDVQALDLLSLLAIPLGQAQATEEMTVDALVSLAKVERSDEFLAQLEELGLIKLIENDCVRLLRPVLVRSGAQALALGLSRPVVIGLLDVINEAMERVAGEFVEAFVGDVWRPFVEADMPDDRWSNVLTSIDALLPVASQAVVAAFRDQLASAIENALGQELGVLTGEQVDRIFGTGPAAS